MAQSQPPQTFPPALDHQAAAASLYRLQYPLHLELPVQLVNANSDSRKKIRTNVDLMEWRLLEHGIAFDEFQNVHHVQQSLQQFRADLLQSGCYQNVHVNIVQSPMKPSQTTTPATTTTTSTSFGTLQQNAQQQQQQQQRLQVHLEEKNWYRLYVGGGIKQQGFGGGADAGGASFSLDTAPSVQMETSIGLVNLTGRLDTTTLHHAVDQHSTSTWNLVHERPLYTAIPASRSGTALGWLHDTILSQKKGSQYMLSMRAVLDTMDYEHVRSYKECQRLLSLKCTNQSARRPELASSPTYLGWEWNLLFRDIIPRRQPQQPQPTTAAATSSLSSLSSPFALDASPEIVQQAGPSLKHSLIWEFRQHGANDRFNPTQGLNVHAKTELALPPGDVGFWKAQGGWSAHVPLLQSNTLGDLLCAHATFSTGLLQPLTFGGMCRPPTVSDRFYCGGPLQLRGFLPCGIGPRSSKHQSPLQVVNGNGSTSSPSPRTSSLTPNGDSLGGDFFYTATLATSVGFGGLQQHHSTFLRDYVRCFAFVNVGTLTGLHHRNPRENLVSWTTIWQSSRVAVGGGCSVATPAGRLEVTYAIPLRYSPRDARRSFQFGLGFAFE